MIPKDINSPFDTQFYELYEKGFFSDELYLSGRKYYDEIVFPVISKDQRHSRSKVFLMFQNFLGKISTSLPFFPNPP